MEEVLLKSSTPILLLKKLYVLSKLIFIVSISDHPGLVVRRQVNKFQEKAFQELRSYVQSVSPDDEDRFPRLLLKLPPLRAFQPHVMEELFFAGLIGGIQIDTVIPYILRTDSSEYGTSGKLYVIFAVLCSFSFRVNSCKSK